VGAGNGSARKKKTGKLSDREVGFGYVDEMIMDSRRGRKIFASPTPI